MKTHKVLTILVLLSMVLAACSTPTAVVSPPTAVSAPTNTAVAPAEATATQPATQAAGPTATQSAAQAPGPTATQPAATATAAKPAAPIGNLFTTVDEYKAATGNSIDKFSEAPMLADQVKAGKLPSLDQRLPKDVAVVKTNDGTAAQYGGQMNLVGTSGTGGVDAQMLEDVMMGLSIPDPTYQNYYPNIAKGWNLSDDGKTLTLYLRQGMKWSDGADFNADDFVFWYEDILQSTDLTPAIDSAFTPGNQLMGLKKVDDYTLEYSFAVPYNRAVERIVGNTIFAPAHFMKQYLLKYNKDANTLAKSENFDTWVQAAQYHLQYPMGDTKAPTLNPWILQDIKTDSALWVRNPYYWRVDTAGNQLPYIDTLLVSVAQDQSKVTPVKAMAGEDDFESQGLALSDYAVLKQNETTGKYKVYLWPDTATAFALGFALNYTVKDPVLRPIFNDLRFRQALSLAIDRNDISQTVFFGKTVPYTAPVSPAWTGYEDWMGTYYAEHDVAKANALLDDMGLKWDSAHLYRLRPDGKTLEILGEHSLDWLSYVDDVLQIVVKNWADIGVKLTPKFVEDGTLMTEYAANGQQVGIFNSDGDSEALARQAYPIRLEPPWHWMGTDCCAMSSYPWRLWLDTNLANNGKGSTQGEEPPQQIKDLYNLVQEWLNIKAGTPEYKDLINQIIKINVDNLYFFGTVSAPPRVVVITNRMGNLPAENGSLGASMFRPYLPETAYIRQ